MIEAIAASAIGLTSIAVSTWLTVKLVRATEHAASVQVAQAHSEGEQTRLAFELETTQRALTESQRRNKLLAEAVHAEIARNRNSDLAPGDVASRLQRLEVEWGTEPAEDHLPALVGDRVPDAAPAAAPNAHPLPSGSATVR